MSKRPALYNPRDMDPALLAELLTGRTELLEELLEDLRQQAKGQTRQHWLLRGQRGIGKTHLAGVIYHHVKTDPVLKQAYVPLWLAESDVYEVYSAATLLDKIVERLVEETEAEEIGAKKAEIDAAETEDSRFEATVELLSVEAQRRERVLLVLMENLDALLESFAPKERNAQTRQLRSLMLHNPHLLIISTTPTQYLKGLHHPQEPLYAHLKERDLRTLTELEVGELYRKLATLANRSDLEEELFETREGPIRLRVIHRLTGGLPRSVSMAFSVLQGNARLESLVDELRALLDEQTAYFEARLSKLAPRERAIMTTMALAPTNLTLKELAVKSRLPERSLSTLVARLERGGHIRPVSGEGGKGTIYEVSEGMFRLWYQYRHGRLVLEPLVELLAYGSEQARARSEQVAPSPSPTTQLALLQFEAALRRASLEESQQAVLEKTSEPLVELETILGVAAASEAACSVKPASPSESLSQMQKWFTLLGQRALAPATERLVSIYSLACDVLVAEKATQGSPQARAKRRNRALGRVPPELRQTIQEIVDRVLATDA